jgi:transposase
MGKMAKFVKWVPAPLLVGVELNPGPGHGERLSDMQLWEIVLSADVAHPNWSGIGRKVGCHRNTAKRVYAKYKETGSVKDLPRQGRKRKLSQAETKQVVKRAMKGKFAPEIAKEYKVTDRTIHRTVKASGKRYLRIKKIEKLSEVNKQKRVEYAKEMMDYDFEKVLFSDEKTFYLGASPGYAWQDPDDRLEVDKEPYPKKLNVWGAVGTYFKTKLYYFDRNLDSDLYSTILRSSIKEKQIIYSPGCPKNLRKKWIFLQDNAKYHTSPPPMKTLRELVGNRLLKHPAKSPDLNPMEDMWSYLDRKVKASKPKTISSLKRVLTKLWKELDWAVVAKSTSSMQRRLQQCIERRGQRLDY